MLGTRTEVTAFLESLPAMATSTIDPLAADLPGPRPAVSAPPGPASPSSSPPP